MKTWKEAFQMELMDDATKTGGISYQGERLDNFLVFFVLFYF